MNRAFAGYHPAVTFLFFTLVLGFGMWFTHPVCLAVSALGAFSYLYCLRGARALGKQLAMLVPVMLVTAAVNPLFSHEGLTILTYLPNDNPITLESICYGISAAAMLITVICWFACLSDVITSDKLVYLFGRVIPALSLLLSMALRFIPRFRAQARIITAAQRNLGRDPGQGTLRHRMRCAVTILSILVTWSLENAIETANSMKSRGYGLPGRSAYSIYRWSGRDTTAVLWMAFCAASVIAAAAAGALHWRYYPNIKGALSGAFTWYALGIYTLLCMTPWIIDVREARVWNALKSRI